MKRKLLIVTIFLVILFVAGILYFGYLYFCEDDWCFIYDWQKAKHTNNFEECLIRGFPVMESYPRQCRTTNGRLFVEEITKKEDIK